MLLTENIAFRLREWLDREAGEPDLVPRFRRLWTEESPRAASEPGALPTSASLRPRPALEAPAS
jgi:hypothetical protein